MSKFEFNNVKCRKLQFDNCNLQGCKFNSSSTIKEIEFLDCKIDSEFVNTLENLPEL